MEKQNYTPEDALKTINEALNVVKNEKTGAAFYYLIWGSFLFAYFFIHYLCIQYQNLNGSLLEQFSWLVFPIGGVFSILRKKNEQHREHMELHYERIYFIAFTGFALAFGIFFSFSVSVSPLLFLTFFPLLSGLTVYIVGGITRHMPSIIGSIAGILCSGFTLLVSVESQFLFAAIAMIVTYVIPGLLMKNKHV